MLCFNEGKTMPETHSILTPAQEAKISAYVDDKIARAERPAPTLASLSGDIKKFEQEEAAYNNNPLAAHVQAFQKEREDQLQNGATPEQADALYKHRVDSMKEHFMAGARKGGPDENAAQQQNNIMNSLLQWPPDLMGIVKSMFMKISVVSDTMAAGGKWLWAKLSGEDIDFATAKERITLERSLGGAAANIGVDAPALTSGGIAAYEDPNFKPTPRPNPQAMTQAVAKAQPPVTVPGHEQGVDMPPETLGEVPTDTKRNNLVLPPAQVIA
jgi:hypothetical protein